MRISVIFKQLNSDFNQEYANQYHFGKESTDNSKSEWESCFKIDENVIEINLKDKTTYILNGRTGNKEFTYSIPDMQVLECVTESGDKYIFAVSNKLISKTHKAQNKKYQKTHYYFYLKDKEEFIDFSGIIIAKQDLPSDLIQQ